MVSAKKIKLFQIAVRFLGHNIELRSIKPINKAIKFASKFLDENLDKKKLERFLTILNYIVDFYKDLALDAKPLFDRLKKNYEP